MCLIPSSVRSTTTLKKLKPLAPERFPDARELHQPLVFKADNNEPSPSCPSKWET